MMGLLLEQPPGLPIHPKYPGANRVKRDFAWSLAGSLPQDFVENEVLPLLGSWTSFNKKVTEFDTARCVQEYLPVYPHPPAYPICKKYLDFLCEVILELEIPHIFSHSDEAVYSKLCHIFWKYPTLYKNIIFLMGGFHQLRVFQKLLFKRHYCRGYKQWCVDAGVIAPGPADQAFEGRHYYRSMRIHKECFDSLMQLRVESITKNHREMNNELLSAIIDLRRSPNASSLKYMMSLSSFNDLFQSMKCVESKSEGEMTITYLKDVSSMLTMISAAREGNIQQHLEAEREMSSLVFAFNHQNYARYCSYNHINLRSMEEDKNPAFRDLQERGLGGSISGEPFSSIHGDLITELFNKETKGAGGPFRGGYSTSIEAVNTWVNTIHIHSRLKQSFKKAILYNTSSRHKELTPGGMKLHQDHIQKLKTKLKEYGVDAFSNEKTKCFPTGEEIDHNVVKDMLYASKKGNELHLKFVEERLTSRDKSFFEAIKKNPINNGMEKKKRVLKAVSVLKEDRPAFGLLTTKAVNLHIALKHPLTTVPLAIAYRDSKMKFGVDKSELRNMLINMSGSSSKTIMKHCSWFIDGMAAVRSMKTRKTYKQWIDAFLRFITPDASFEPKEIGLINDVYFDRSVKGGMRRARGETKKSKRVKIEGFKQHMLQGNQWQDFLSCSENKNELISLIARYISSTEGSANLKYPFIFTAGDKTFKSTSGQVEMLFTCNHEEADTRLILHALLCENDVVIVCEDTDVMILLAWAYFRFNITKKWYMNYAKERYADIGKIAEFLGPAVSICLPALHGLTGCDTTSHFHNTSKTTILKKVIANPEKLSLIQNIGMKPNLDQMVVDDAKEFIRTVLYSGKKNELYIDTRVRLHKAKKVKSSCSLPPDEDSVTQAIYRIHYQVYTWIRSNEINIEHLDFNQYGWKWCVERELVVPVWFKGDQYPPEFSSRRKKAEENEGDADDELEKTERRKKRKRKSVSIPAERYSHSKSKFKQMVHEETKLDEDEALTDIISKSYRVDESSDNEQNPPYGNNVEDGDDEESANEGHNEEKEFCSDSYNDFDDNLLYNCNEEFSDNSIEFEWEVSDFLTTDESDNEWKP